MQIQHLRATPSLAQRQFRLPHGLVGRLAGWFMARENRRLNRMAIDWLEVEPDDDVLEIGFGPGHGIALLAEQTAARSIAGVDPSAEMVHQASARNQTAVAAGRVSLVLGTVAALPFPDASFSRVVVVSNFHIWPSRADGVQEIYRVLAAGGRFVICVRLALREPWPWSSPGVSTEQLHRDEALLRKQGFSHVQRATRKHRRRSVCLVATK